MWLTNDRILNYSRLSSYFTNYSRLSPHFTNLYEHKVAYLIDDRNRKWKKELIEATFPAEISEKIFCIPLAKEPHDDFLVWRGESSGEFTVRSAYKLLQSFENDPRAYALQNESRNFYRNIWLLNLPPKLKIIEELLFLEVLQAPYMDFVQWLTWVFEKNSPNQRRIFCCALWAIWGERNKRVHEKTNRSGKEIAFFIKRYISELNEIEAKVPQVKIGGREWKHPPGQFVKVNFDAAYDGNLQQSAAGIVARDSEGNTLLSCIEIHHQVASAFAAEAIACRTATQIGRDMQWPNIIIEGDALSIIKKCKLKSYDKSMIGAYIQDIHQLLEKSGKCYFKYIPREANSLAHKLATETLKKKEESYLIGRVPGYAENLEETEKRSGTNVEKK
ncbi:hypothetical protein Godav_004268 [Gossypium davidsonii]|uniref:RNase H type-1 domain-containing protein n=3 Tax=Gossypium davidsonii TaxID=34287 RepID=A0A7J8SLC1_GOSDV|nr:hypothetical protein [Gossypium davidsonii]